MAINTEVYGSETSWLVYGLTSNYSRENFPQFARFSDDLSDISVCSSLLAGSKVGKFEINKPIDTSFSFIGVDDNSSIANQRWYKQGNSLDETFKVSMEKNGVNSLGWAYVNYIWSSLGNITSLRLSPYTAWAYEQEINDTNPDCFIAPCTRVPMSMVFPIIVRVANMIIDENNTDQIKIISLDLYTYINGHVTNTTDSKYYYEEYPIILSIYTYPATRNNTEGTTLDIGKQYRGLGLPERFCVCPIILNQIEQFTDPDNLEKEYKLLRYSQPTLCSTNRDFRAINHYATTPTISGSSISTYSNYPILLFGGISNDITIGDSGSYYMGVVGHEDKLHTKFFNYPNGVRHWTFWSTLNDFGGISGFQEYCRRQVAYLGGFFTESWYSAAYEPVLDTEFCFLGIIDDSGVTHGDYSQGAENRNQKQWDWTDFSKSPYTPPDPSKPTPPKYDDITKLSGIKHAGNAFVNLYSCTYATVKNLKRFLYSDVAKETTQEKLYQSFLTTNPIDCITGCYEFPFSTAPARQPSTNIVIGNVIASGGEQYPITGREIDDTLITLDFGSALYEPAFNNFLDYEPYSTAELYIPYVGFIPISPADFMNQVVGVKMICDLMTGSCEALIYRNGLVVESANGNIGTQVPITGIQQADYANAVHSASTRLAMANTSVLNSIANTVTSVASGNIGAGISSALGLTDSLVNKNQAEYELNHVSVPFKQTGTASPNINFANEQRCRLIMKRPILDEYDPSIYGQTVGYACCKTGKLSSFTGRTVCSNVRLSNLQLSSGVIPTDTEKQMIIDWLTRGVII